MRQRVGEDTRVGYAEGTDPVSAADLLPGPPPVPSSILTPPGSAPGTHGLQAEYWTNSRFEGELSLVRVERQIGLNLGLFNFTMANASSLPQVPEVFNNAMSVRWTGSLIAPITGNYTLSLTHLGTARLFVDGQLLIDDPGLTLRIESVARHLVAGEQLALRIEYAADRPEQGASSTFALLGAKVRFGWQPPLDVIPSSMLQAAELARKSDVAIVVVRDYNSEHADRPGLTLPNEQDLLVQTVVTANPRTIVVIASGDPVLMPWLDQIPAVLEIWYGGQEIGNAVADVLFGDVNPSGKLPVTFPRSDHDTPVSSPEQYSRTERVAHFSEGLGVGYRGYDQLGIEPLFPFGYGLSYTSFAYSQLHMEPETTDGIASIQASFTITNTGACVGTEIAQVYLAFAPTACFLYDCIGFLTSWLADLAAEQTAKGVVPFIVPNILPLSPLPAAAWGDAAVIVPWVLYQRYGNKGILAAQVESMCAWVDLVTSLAGEKRLWNRGFQFGDWLDPSAPANKPGAGPTNPHVVATAYFARSAELLGQIASVLGRTEDAARYLRLAAEVRDAFNAEYVTPAGRVISDSATAYTLALQFGLLRDKAQRQRAGARLAALVRNSGYHISTGHVGTPLICDALCCAGEYDTGFHLLNQQGCPSWLYPVTMGATTIWERWDSLRPDGSINPNQMTSFNHYALGSVADWMHHTSEFIDDPEAWTTVLTTIRQHIPQLSSHLNVGSIIQEDGSMTLRESLSLLPHAKELQTALGAALAKIGRASTRLEEQPTCIRAMMNFHEQHRTCHAERSEASRGPSRQTLRFAESDMSVPILFVKNHYRGSSKPRRKSYEYESTSSCRHACHYDLPRVWQWRRRDSCTTCTKARLAID
jgi:hypothetical protein